MNISQLYGLYASQLYPTTATTKTTRSLLHSSRSCFTCCTFSLSYATHDAVVLTVPRTIHWRHVLCRSGSPIFRIVRGRYKRITLKVTDVRRWNVGVREREIIKREMNEEKNNDRANLEKWMMRNKRQRKSETIDNVSAEQTEDQVRCVDWRAE